MSFLRPSTRRLFLGLAPVALVLSVAGANTHFGPGITFKVKTQLKNHRAPEKEKPDSVRIKRLAAEAAARVDDITVGDAADGRGAGGGRPAANANGANNVLTMTAAFVKGAGRFDVLGVIGSPELKATEAAIITDTSTTFVDDVEKTWRSSYFNIGSILDFTTAVDNPVVKVGMLKVKWDSLPSETYEGRPAKHYQLKMMYGLSQRGREDSLKDLAITDVTSDYLVCDLPVNFENRFAGIGRPRRQVPDSLRGEWEKMLGLYAQLGKGTIVKFTAAGFIGINTGRTTEYTRTMDMTNIVAGDVDESRLKVPEGYTKVTPQRGRGGN